VNRDQREQYKGENNETMTIVLVVEKCLM